MSMIFKISGNYVENGKWATPSPAFEGEILIDDKNVLKGYVTDFADPDINYREKHLIGALGITDVNTYGVAFYKLSNYPYYATKMYLVLNMDIPESAIWAKKDQNGMLIAQSVAKVRFDRMPYSDTMSEEILRHFDSLCKLEYGEIHETYKICAKAVATAC